MVVAFLFFVKFCLGHGGCVGVEQAQEMGCGRWELKKFQRSKRGEFCLFIISAPCGLGPGWDRVEMGIGICSVVRGVALCVSSRPGLESVYQRDVVWRLG